MACRGRRRPAVVVAQSRRVVWRDDVGVAILPRRRRQLDVEPVVPLPPGPVTNGEYVPAGAGRGDAAVGKVLHDELAVAARRAGIDRRKFLESAGAVAACLAVYDLVGCSRARRPSSSRSSTAGPGGRFTTPDTADIAACQNALGSCGEFIFDVHTHHVVPTGPWRKNAPETVNLVLGMVPPECRSTDRLQCVDRAAYLHDLFLASDTTVALLSDVPNSGPDDAPVPFADAVGTQQLAAALGRGGAPRILVHNIVAPNIGDYQARLAAMTAAAATGHVAGFKVYPAWNPSGPGFSLLDPKIGLPTIEHAHNLGIKVFTAHKGLPLVNFDAAHNGPDDIVAASRLYPDMNFIVYHAAWDPHHPEGPYNPRAAVGIDTLLAALDRHGVAPNDNVWVDLGTTWRQLLTDPTQAAHALGKLLKRVGPQRILWGTDAIWYGSPQPQIMAFRAFSITAEFQDAYGYPALSNDIKRDIFGRNAARLFNLDPEATRCALQTDPLSANTANAADLRQHGALPAAAAPNGPTTRRDKLRWIAAQPWLPS